MIRIAAVSEDGVTISQHFGRAPMYVVVSVEEGRPVSRETRDKLGHAQFATEGHEVPPEADPRGHGFDPVAQDRHARMVAAIADARSCWRGGWAPVPSRACSTRASSSS